MTTYCAPCLADLALVREAVTSVSGTAACVAHAVLLTHPTDTPQRRLTRLSDLRAMAEGKLATASAEDVPAIELLVQEYALAGAMDMTVPLKDLAGDRTPRPPKSRRDRGRDRGRERPGGERAAGDRPAGDRPAGDRGPRPDAPPLASEGGDTAAPEPVGRSEGAETPPPLASEGGDTAAPEPVGRSEDVAAGPEAPAPAPAAAPEAPAATPTEPSPAASEGGNTPAPETGGRSEESTPVGE